MRRKKGLEEFGIALLHVINPIKTKRGRLSPSGSFFLHISEINRTNNLKLLDFVTNLVIIHLPKFESVITCILKVISN